MIIKYTVLSPVLSWACIWSSRDQFEVVFGLVSDGTRIHCYVTGQLTRISEDLTEQFNWTCAQIEEPGRVSLRPTTKEECPGRCHLHGDCTSCLSSEGAEGGFSECHWASYLGKCISPAYQPVYCAGGVCGLVLTKADKNKCPAPCGTFEQCSECLHHSHCGWCALEGANGEGVCTEGSIDTPLDYTTRTTCAAVYENMHQSNNTNDTFSWHYTRCPPENECENNHHQCKADSEVGTHRQVSLVIIVLHTVD